MVTSRALRVLSLITEELIVVGTGLYVRVRTSDCGASRGKPIRIERERVVYENGSSGQRDRESLTYVMLYIVMCKY